MVTLEKVLISIVFLSVSSIFAYILVVSSGYDVGNISPVTHRYFRRNTTPTTTDAPTEDIFAQCHLPQYDPFDADVMKFFDPHVDEEKDCKPATMKTFIKKGRVYQQDSNVYCMGRCITRKTNKENTYGEWIEINKKEGTSFTCDIIETKCSDSSNSASFYGNLHTQVVPKPTPEPKVNKASGDEKQYNVYYILLDSVAMSQAYRALSKTMNYLENTMKAIPFPYLNKVGLNSRPNGIPLWFGKRIEAVDRTFFGLPSFKADLGYDFCVNHVDYVPSLFNNFSDYGYKVNNKENNNNNDNIQTLLAEDSHLGLADYPSCAGFDKQPTDHYFQPYELQLKVENSLPGQTLSLKNCISKHEALLSYLGDFIDSYPNDPKFAFTWLINLGHDNHNAVIAGDDDLYVFFMKNQKKLDNSFVILSGDHGFRQNSDLRNTKLGEYDVNNPFLTIVLPKDLRNNTELVATMKENSQKLVTHYDTRATLFDIMKFQPRTGFTSRESMKMEGEVGNSLMREMKGERSCRTLPIPLQYCLCDYPKNTLQLDSPLAREIGEKVVSLMNDRLKQNNVSHLCEQWRYANMHDFFKITSPVGRHVYTTFISTVGPYAEFKTQLIEDNNGTSILAEVDRTDVYGHKSSCIKSVAPHLSNLCNCRERGWG